MRWIPLESNPETLTNYAKSLGVQADVSFTDVWSLDAEMLAYIPRPVLAVLLLFPVTPRYEAFRHDEEKRILEHGQGQGQSRPYFMRQTIGNACGTIAVIHALANNISKLDLSQGSVLKEIVDKTREMDADAIARVLEQDEKLAGVHSAVSLQGQTSAPNAEENVDLHFASIVAVDGQVYELDGRKPFPIHHGACTGDLMVDAARVIQTFISREPESMQFTTLALVQGQH